MTQEALNIGTREAIYDPGGLKYRVLEAIWPCTWPGRALDGHMAPVHGQVRVGGLEATYLTHPLA